MLRPVDTNMLVSLTGNKKKCILMYTLFIPLKWCRKVFIHSINPILIT